MKKDQIEVSRGSGNVFRDLNMPNPDLEQLRAILAARIIKVLDGKKLNRETGARVDGHRGCGLFADSPGEDRSVYS